MTLSKNILINMIVALLVIATFIFMGCSISNLKHKLKVSDHNYETSRSELTVEKMKNEKLLYEKEAYILNEKQMMEELEISKDEMKELNKKLSEQSVYISKLESEIRIDTVLIKNDSIVYVDNTPRYVYFKNTDPWLMLKGKSDILTKLTSLYDIKIPVPITVGLTKDYSIFIETENPYLNITDVKAVALQDFVNKTAKKKHWGVGAYGGIGAQYGFIHKQFDFGLQIGVGVVYRF